MASRLNDLIDIRAWRYIYISVVEWMRKPIMHIVSGASHIGMYDKPDLVAEAMSKLGPFFKAKL